MNQPKITIKVDVTKIPKDKIVSNSFKNAQGEEITSKDVSFDIVPLKEAKSIKKGDGWEMVKTHFVTISASKEEKAEKKKMPIIGDGIQFIKNEAEKVDNSQDFELIPF